MKKSTVGASRIKEEVALRTRLLAACWEMKRNRMVEERNSPPADRFYVRIMGNLVIWLGIARILPQHVLIVGNFIMLPRIAQSCWPSGRKRETRIQIETKIKF